jgi:hypothetical protein
MDQISDRLVDVMWKLFLLANKCGSDKGPVRSLFDLLSDEDKTAIADRLLPIDDWLQLAQLIVSHMDEPPELLQAAWETLSNNDVVGLHSRTIGIELDQYRTPAPPAPKIDAVDWRYGTVRRAEPDNAAFLPEAGLSPDKRR